MGRYRIEEYTFIIHKNGYIYYRSYDGNNKRFKISTGTKDMREAKRIVLDLLKEGKLIPENRRAKSTSETKEAELMSFKTFTDGFFDSDSDFRLHKKKFGKENAEATYNKNKKDMNKNIKPYFDEFNLKDITKEMVENWLFKLEKKNTTKNNQKSTLNTILDFAVQQGFMIENPCKKIEFFKSDVKRHDCLLPSETEKLFSDTSNFSKQIYFDMCKLLNLTGTRIGELRAIEVSDVDYDKGFLKINKSLDDGSEISGKTKSEAGNRQVPIFREAIEILNKYTLNKKEGRIFAKDGSNVPPGSQTILNNLKLALIKSGISEQEIKERSLVTHSFRHSFVTYLATNGKSAETIKTLVGHSTSKMVETYIHSDEQKAKDDIAHLFA